MLNSLYSLMTFMDDWTHLPILVIIIPLLSAPFCLMIKSKKISFVIALNAIIWVFMVTLNLINLTIRNGIISYHLGNWAPPIGIEFRVDVLNASLCFLVAVSALFVICFSPISLSRKMVDQKKHLFYTLFLLCFTGLLGILITGDAFNAFIFLEISSLSTYALIGLGSDNRALISSFNYLIMGTIGATFYLIGVGLLLGLTGTLNMIDLAKWLAIIPINNTVYTAFAFITLGICVKVAIFTMHFWLPNAYAYANSAIAIFIASVSTKVSLYLLIRFIFTIFGVKFVFGHLKLDYILLPLAILGIILASILASYQQNVKKVMAFSSIAQLGYILMAICLMTHASLRAGMIHFFNHAMIKGCLFMSMACMVYRIGGLRISKFSGIAHEMPISFICFVIGGLSLIGIPFTSGFISKWYFLLALIDNKDYGLVFVILFSSVLALIYVWRVFEIAWFRPKGNNRQMVKEAPITLLIPTIAFAFLNLYFGLKPEMIVYLSEQIANLLLPLS